MSEYVSALFEAVEMVLGTPLPTLARQEVTPEEALKFLSDTLITLPAYSDDLLFAVDSVNNLCPARHEMSLANLTLSINLSTDKIKNAKAVVWQGDITTLQVDAILNAANEKGLGCFEPSHRCIDNVIHRAAGPRLRVECNQLMRARGAQLVAGSVPIISKGYNLPSKFVIHATGPQLFRGESLTKEHEQLLSSTYRNVLDLAHSHKLKSLALCCISTGLFGYPSKEAPVTALQTVKQWFDEHVDTTLEIVVFNVFSDEDFHPNSVRRGVKHEHAGAPSY
ncbi:hypothetical protein TrVE_jg854 [Triparma verrucosa]|uniref:Macro domain-containing protein n=1 Tax=Triparma verrucosa TaxID=1606542 RepID=A0A9W7F971_9STRA|nr:hypothetical protein TrVE_jg854 [Triparma verrucosa]